MIPVTKTFFPPLEDYHKQAQRIWDNQWLTNNGELYQDLSTKLKDHLGVNHIIPMTNGTLPIQIALNEKIKAVLPILILTALLVSTLEFFMPQMFSYLWALVKIILFSVLFVTYLWITKSEILSELKYYINKYKVNFKSKTKNN